MEVLNTLGVVLSRHIHRSQGLHPLVLLIPNSNTVQGFDAAVVGTAYFVIVIVLGKLFQSRFFLVFFSNSLKMTFKHQIYFIRDWVVLALCLGLVIVLLEY